MKTITPEIKNTLDKNNSLHIARGEGELTQHWALSKMETIKITEKNDRVSVSCGIMSNSLMYVQLVSKEG